MKKLIMALMVLVVLFVAGCNTETQETDDVKITNFEQCVEEGNPIMESHPRQCKTEDGQTFTESMSRDIGVACAADVKECPDGNYVSRVPPECNFAPCPQVDTDLQGSVCVDMCGDGICQEVVCESTSCPCAETKTSCPEDCA